MLALDIRDHFSSGNENKRFQVVVISDINPAATVAFTDSFVHLNATVYLIFSLAVRTIVEGQGNEPSICNIDCYCYSFSQSNPD